MKNNQAHNFYTISFFIKMKLCDHDIITFIFLNETMFKWLNRANYFLITMHIYKHSFI